jgi:hypothetical protein
MLAALKQWIAPTNQACEVELVYQYNKLKKASHNQNVNVWLHE